MENNRVHLEIILSCKNFSIIVILIPVDGNWAAWANWTDCSKTCLGGMKNRTRTCSDPPPDNDGANCTNSTDPTVTGNGLVETELIPCNSFPCDSDTCNFNFH